MRDLSCRTNDKDKPHEGEITQKSTSCCCDMLVFLLDWSVSEQVPLAGFLS